MSDFTPDPNQEEEYWNVLYCFRCLDTKHQDKILEQLEFERGKNNA
jgi:hypothetical protein